MTIINMKDFPDELHRKAKAEAALEGISLKALIIKAIEEYLYINNLNYSFLRLDLIAIDINKRKKTANIKHYKNIL